MSLQPLEPRTPAQIEETPVGGDVDLRMWAGNLDDSYKLASALCTTSFVPSTFRGKPEEAAAAIMMGKSLGMDPMIALTNIFVVSGRPSMYARTMAALVLSEGHELVRTEATPEQVTYKARRKGQEEWQAFTWSMERARMAGYDKNPLYKKDPLAMLTAKAQAEACRTIAPDVLSGIPYSVEDVQLFDENIPANTPEPANPTRKVTRKTKPEPTPEQAQEIVSEALGAEVVEEEQPTIDWASELDSRRDDVEALRWLYDQAHVHGADQTIVDEIKAAGIAASQQGENK